MVLKQSLEVGIRSVKSMFNVGENIWLAANDSVEIRSVSVS
jgi:hypothetical protein